jgi:YVTN family beta-propeller protein
MKNFRNISIWVFSVMIAGFLTISCDKEEDFTIDCSNGVFIVNEGAYGSSNGSVSFYSNADDKVINDVFYKVNGVQLGDVVQSATVVGDTVYIVVNNSNKIEAAYIKTMLEVGVIEGVTSPRYMVNKNKTAYVSCWGDNSVKIVDLKTFSVTGSIVTGGTGPEKMLLNGNKLYVVNTGGWGNDSTLSVINTETNEVIKNIEVPYNPKDLVKDIDGNIWLLSYGIEIYGDTAAAGNTPSYLYKIDPSTDEVIASFKLYDNKHPAHLGIAIDGSTLFIGGGYTFEGIRKVTVSGDNISITDIGTDSFYGVDVDPSSGVIFGTIAGDYASPGTLKRFETDGTLLGTYTCGIGTSGAAFKNTK